MLTSQREVAPETLRLLPLELRSKEVFSYVSTIRPPSKNVRNAGVGFSNLILNAVFLRIGKDNLVGLHFQAFMDQCDQLNLAFYETENDSDDFKIFVKAAGKANAVNQLLQRREY